MSESKQLTTTITNVMDQFFPLIQQQFSVNGLNMSQYQRQCVMSAISGIHTALESKGIAWNDAQLDRSTISQILFAVASLKLNASASPREVYFQVRNTSIKVKDPEGGKDLTNWKKKVEMGVEGDGNDAILANFGRDVQKVCPFWLVREKDKFEYPKYKGVTIEPPVWEPSGQGEVIRVVYPIVKNDGTIDYYIGERADVAKNLLAHISNNLMNETFGICKDRYKATEDEKKQIAAKKKEILRKAYDLGLGALDDPGLEAYISPAWTEFQSREQMIIRKIRNNIVKKIPKDFGNAYVEMTYHQNTDEAGVVAEISANANSETIDVVAETVQDPEMSSEQENIDIQPTQQTEEKSDPQPDSKPARGPGF